MRLCLAWCAWVGALQAEQPPPRAGDAPLPVEVAEPAQDATSAALACDPSVRRDSIELDVALAELVARHPMLVSVEPLAASESGRVLSAVQLHDRTTGEAGAKPGLVVVSGLDAPLGFEADVVFAALCRLAEAFDTDAEIRRTLRHVVVHAVLDADPDERARALAGRAQDPNSELSGIAIDRNFPAGWDPWVGGPAAGPYPLIRTEARALARHLSERSNLSVVLVLRSTAAPERLGALASYGAANARAGSLLEFVRSDLGGFGFVGETFLAGEVGELQRETEVELVRGAILGLAQRLPHVELSLLAATRLRDDLWQIDLEVENVGGLPTMGLERAGSRATSLLLRSEGARVLAAAERDTLDGSFVVRSGDPHDLSLANLAGGDAITVRLLVASAEPSGVAIFLSSERAGQARVDVALE